jgi:hypothetical protein
MVVRLVTGAIDRDYVELLAETLAECNQLVACGQSKFVLHDTFYLKPAFTAGNDTVGLLIYISPARGHQLDLPTREAIDSTP